MNSLSLPSIPRWLRRLSSSKLSACASAVAVVLLWLIPMASTSAATVLQNVEYASLAGNQVSIELQLSGMARQPRVFSTDNPARIVLDLEGVTDGLGKKTVPISVGPVQSLVAVEASNRTRVVINLSDSVPYQVNTSGNKVNIALNAPQQVADAPRQAPSRPIAARLGSRPSTSAGSVRNIDFKRGPGGEGRVLITLPSPNTRVSVTEKGKRVIAEIANARLPGRLLRRLDVTDFATPVLNVESRPQGNNVEVSVETTPDYEYLAYQADNLFTLEFRPLSKAEKEDQRRKKVVYQGDRLSLNFQNIEVRAVLQLLADFTGLNLVASDAVSGSITLRLKNVPWDQALDIILKSKGLSMRQTGNVILVAPTADMVAQEQAELLADQKIEELAPLRSEFIQVNYGRAEDLAVLLKSPDNQFLTPERGSVTVDKRTNTLLVLDTAARLEEIRSLIQRLDIPVRQVMIESRVVIANNDFARNLGVRFGASKYTGGGFDSSSGALAGNVPAVQTLSTEPIYDGYAVTNPDTGISTVPLLVNLPAAGATSGANFLLGKIGSYLLQLELTAMQREGRGEIISSPRVITSDNRQATIKVGQEIPYQESSQNSITNTVAFKEAVLKLDVTPQITPDDRIIMQLKVNKDSPDFSRSVNGQPPIDTRAVETNVLVDNGETVVLGGVFERTKSFNKEQVPWLGDIPVLGNLFKSTSRTDNNTELLIFVTPKILKEGVSGIAYAPAIPAGPTPPELMK